MIELDKLSKTFTQKNGKEFRAVDSVSLTVEKGEICVFLGPSGCGKTTTLKMINRIIPPTSGRVLIDGQDTADLDEVTLRRHIGYVIQQIGLFPNMTIEENIMVVPRLLGWDKARCKEKARELMSMVKLEPKQYLQRYPRELSGGQQQRVGVIRALAADAPLLLMDEPFGAVDPINRESIQNEFFEMQRKLGMTVIMVSHDIDEAIKLGDKVAVFKSGRLLQYDHPDTLLEMWQANAGGRYRHKNDRYLAPLDPNFGGVGRTLTDSEGHYYFRTIKPGPYPWRNGPNDWRPAHIHVSVSGPAIAARLVTQMYFEGDPLIPKCPIIRTLADPEAAQSLIGRLDMSMANPMDCLAYRFDIVLRGQRKTFFENA